MSSYVGMNTVGVRNWRSISSIPSESSSKVCGFFSFPFLESVAFEDAQPVVLEDGSMAYIHNTVKGKECSLFFPWQLEQKPLNSHRFRRL